VLDAGARALVFVNSRKRSESITAALRAQEFRLDFSMPALPRMKGLGQSPHTKANNQI